MQDEQMVEACSPHTAQKPFTDGIGSRGVIRGFENLDVTRLRNPCETHPKLAIIIPDELLRFGSRHSGLVLPIEVKPLAMPA
jgi:hypothetical protein